MILAAELHKQSTAADSHNDPFAFVSQWDEEDANEVNIVLQLVLTQDQMYFTEAQLRDIDNMQNVVDERDQVPGRDLLGTV